MSTMSRHCQNRVQRLRDFGGDTLWSSGSRGLAPGVLRLLLCPICSNSRRDFVSPVDWDWQVLPVRLCESEPCQTPPVKSRGQHGFGEIPAQIAAFQGWASSRIHYVFTTIACWLGVRTGTFPPLILRCPRLRGPRSISFHDPPLRALPLIRPSATFSRWKKREKALRAGPSPRLFWREKVPDRADDGPCVPLAQQKTATPSQESRFRSARSRPPVLCLSHSALRLPADDLPVRLSCTSSYPTFWPSLRPFIPARSTALM